MLKGDAPPYPKHPRQGSLELISGQVRWRPSWGLRRKSLLINEPIRSIDVRAAGRSEWNVKKGGKAFGVVQIPEFRVVVAKTDRGLLEFSVPSTDVELVRAALQGTSGASG
jgi:hypothetical protein